MALDNASEKKYCRHRWVEEMDDPDKPVAVHERCELCGILRANETGPNRPFSVSTPGVLLSAQRTIEDNARTYTRITCHPSYGGRPRKDRENAYFFKYPEEQDKALAQVMNRSIRQVRWLLEKGGL